MVELSSYQKLFLLIASIGLLVGRLIFGSNTEIIVGLLQNGWYPDDVFDFWGDKSNEPEPIPFTAQVSDPVVSCEGKELVITFEFDQPVSGNFRLQWFDSSDNHAKILNANAEENTVLIFRFTNAPKDYEDISIIHVYLVFEDGSQYGISIYDQQYDEGAWYWDACSPPGEETTDANNEPDAPPYIPPVVEPPVTETPNLDGTPVIINSTCVGKGAGKQLMIVFEFEQDVAGEYSAVVADIPYELASVTQYPDRLYYFGTPPPQGPITIKLVSTSNQAVAYEETYTPVVCGPQEKKDDDDDGGYTPPSY